MQSNLNLYNYYESKKNKKLIIITAIVAVPLLIIVIIVIIIIVNKNHKYGLNKCNTDLDCVNKPYGKFCVNHKCERSKNPLKGCNSNQECKKHNVDKTQCIDSKCEIPLGQFIIDIDEDENKLKYKDVEIVKKYNDYVNNNKL